MHATNSWLQPGKVNQALGPDCDDSPHSIRASSLDLGIAPYLAVLFGPQKADKDHQAKKVKQEGSQSPDANQEKDNELPSLLTLRVEVDSCRPADLSALTTILLGGTPAHQVGDVVALCRDSTLFPSGVHVSIRAKNVLVSHSTPDDPQRSTLIARGWVDMTWEGSKTMISASALTSTVSPFMALR